VFNPRPTLPRGTSVQSIHPCNSRGCRTLRFSEGCGFRSNTYKSFRSAGGAPSPSTPKFRYATPRFSGWRVADPLPARVTGQFVSALMTPLAWAEGHFDERIPRKQLAQRGPVDTTKECPRQKSKSRQAQNTSTRENTQEAKWGGRPSARM
jgi:hypothetical protein